MKTIPLKLYKPSREKRRLLDDAMRRYSYALEYLLEHTRDLLPVVEQEARRGGFKTRRIISQIGKDVMLELNRFGVEPFKDSLKMDCALMLLNYVAQRKGRGGEYPVACWDEEQLSDRFDYAIQEYDAGRMGREGLDNSLKALYARYDRRRSMLFCRYAQNRDYCLLYDGLKDRFYAKLYLLNVKSKERRGGIARGEAALRYVAFEGQPLEQDNQRERYIVVPLAFGQWQRGYLMEALRDPSVMKTARLEKRGEDYYLMLHMVCKAEEEAQRPVNTMGISRSVKGFAQYTVCSPDGSIIASGILKGEEGGSLKGLSSVRRPLEKNAFHAAANRIVELAKRYRCQCILYTLTNKADGIAKRQYPVLYKGEHNRLVFMLNYKLESAGLPPAVNVSPRNVFYTCPRCSYNSRRNRMNEDLFMCTSCGYSHNFHALGSYNLANWLKIYNERKVAFFVQRKEQQIRIFNDVMKVEFRAVNESTVFENFYLYLQEVLKEGAGVDDRLSQSEQKKRYSIYKKLSTAPDIRDIVYFREVGS
ncbi:MAG: zinc ribbon domain-containing protein [Christensenellales bacterium]